MMVHTDVTEKKGSSLVCRYIRFSKQRARVRVPTRCSNLAASVALNITLSKMNFETLSGWGVDIANDARPSNC
jgi:hypothetical protein